MSEQLFAIDETSVRGQVTKGDARDSIDDLVAEAWQYRQSEDFRRLIEFVGGFRFQAPFNALLLHIQRPGATYVETARNWRERYGRKVKPGERPLVVLWTFGPVMFVYDVSQTEPDAAAPVLPLRVELPFAMPPVVDSRPVHYEVEHNAAFTPTEVYATLAHELGHLYCGHLGTPNPKWWPDRRGLPEPVMEFEAEAVAFMACRRLDPDAALPPHLAQHLDAPTVPESISLEQVVRATGRVVDMAVKRMPRRKDR